MKIRGYKLSALLKKDMKLMLTNRNAIFIILLPLLFAALFQYILMESPGMEELPQLFVLLLCEIMNLSAIPSSITCMMVAEEKEKNTMRTLLLTDVSALEFLLSKALIVLAVMEVVGMLIFFIADTPVMYLPVYLLLTTLVSIAVLFFGSSVGLLAKDQMSSGSYAAPIMLLMMIPPVLSSDGTLFGTVARALPTTSFYDLFSNLIYEGTLSTGRILLAYGVILLWILLGMLFFIYVYRKKGIDN